MAEARDCVHGQVHCIQLNVRQVVQQVGRQWQAGVLGTGHLRKRGVWGRQQQQEHEQVAACLFIWQQLRLAAMACFAKRTAAARQHT